ncbi:hypothetical protein GPX89_26235 [Nocardia sp. ET3-3]|uniref:Uncharacterized protein n=1 Tax=Nocardia terrae TaxID=2675851 RepID=A0A7K1V2R8_9NOCA|nr:hypothetical protein [Nocardia terrae]MVU80739.1 hypothetical protein [Nocardia terrae]
MSIIAMFVFFIEAARMGRRDRVYPMALWMTALWWPHDGSYLLRFDKWFHGYHHWFMELFWFAIVVTFLAESTFAVQTVLYGRDELSPGRSMPVHALRVGGALACGVISWSLLKGAFADDLYLISFMGTLMWGGPSGSALLMRHPDGKGQSVLEWVAFTVMAVMYSIASIFLFGGGFFHSLWYVLICLVSIVWSSVHLVQIWRTSAAFSSSRKLDKYLRMRRKSESEASSVRPVPA